MFRTIRRTLRNRPEITRSVRREALIRPILEVLEDRTSPAVLSVTGGGTGSFHFHSETLAAPIPSNPHPVVEPTDQEHNYDFPADSAHAGDSESGISSATDWGVSSSPSGSASYSLGASVFSKVVPYLEPVSDQKSMDTHVTGTVTVPIDPSDPTEAVGDLLTVTVSGGVDLSGGGTATLSYSGAVDGPTGDTPVNVKIGSTITFTFHAEASVSGDKFATAAESIVR